MADSCTGNLFRQFLAISVPKYTRDTFTYWNLYFYQVHTRCPLTDEITIVRGMQLSLPYFSHSFQVSFLFHYAPLRSLCFSFPRTRLSRMLRSKLLRHRNTTNYSFRLDICTWRVNNRIFNWNIDLGKAVYQKTISFPSPGLIHFLFTLRGFSSPFNDQLLPAARAVKQLSPMKTYGNASSSVQTWILPLQISVPSTW